MRPLRIGTRGSALALWQANFVAAELQRLHGVECELVRIRTAGDHLQSASVAQINAQSGMKGLFIKELEEALLCEKVDLAVHSMKDVPTETPAGLAFAAITRREDPRDCLIARPARTLQHLGSGARVGTSSLRRQAQLRNFRPDLQMADLRGNVDTRLKKLAAGEFDAIVLAMAGVNRLGASKEITQVLQPELMLPAVGQGALGIETRAGDSETSRLVAALDDAETRACVTAERALLHKLEGGCQVPLGAFARIHGGEFLIEARVYSPDGSECVRGEERGAAQALDAPEEIGKRLARKLIEAGAARLLRMAGRAVEEQSQWPR